MKRLISYILLLLFIKFNVLAGINPSLMSLNGTSDRCCIDIESSIAACESSCSTPNEDTFPTHKEEKKNCDDESHDCFCMQCACCHAPLYWFDNITRQSEPILFGSNVFSYSYPIFFPILQDVWQPPRFV